MKDPNPINFVKAEDPNLITLTEIKARLLIGPTKVKDPRPSRLIRSKG